MIEVPAPGSSAKCAACGTQDPDSQKNQSQFSVWSVATPTRPIATRRPTIAKVRFIQHAWKVRCTGINPFSAFCAGRRDLIGSTIQRELFSRVQAVKIDQVWAELLNGQAAPQRETRLQDHGNVRFRDCAKGISRSRRRSGDRPSDLMLRISPVS